jgi:excisionase family DNA binding protein
MKGHNVNTNLNNLPLLLEVPAAAKLLGISRSAAYRATTSGELASRRLGGRVYVVTAKLIELVEA